MKKESLFRTLGNRLGYTGRTIIMEENVSAGDSPQEKAGCVRKDEIVAYEQGFLKRNKAGHRKQTYISYETYQALARVLPVLHPGMSIPEYLDNVLAHHLDAYGKEIGKLIDEKLPHVKL